MLTLFLKNIKLIVTVVNLLFLLTFHFSKVQSINKTKGNENGWLNYPDDILLEICKSLDCSSLEKMRQTSKNFKKWTESMLFWKIPDCVSHALSEEDDIFENTHKFVSSRYRPKFCFYEKQCKVLELMSCTDRNIIFSPFRIRIWSEEKWNRLYFSLIKLARKAPKGLTFNQKSTLKFHNYIPQNIISKNFDIFSRLFSIQLLITPDILQDCFRFFDVVDSLIFMEMEDLLLSHPMPPLLLPFLRSLTIVASSIPQNLSVFTPDKLEYLELRASSISNDLLYFIIKENVNTLKALRICCTESLSQDVIAVIENLENLEVLELSIHNVESRLAVNLKGMKNLKELEVDLITFEKIIPGDLNFDIKLNNKFKLQSKPSVLFNPNYFNRIIGIQMTSIVKSLVPSSYSQFTRLKTLKLSYYCLEGSDFASIQLPTSLEELSIINLYLNRDFLSTDSLCSIFGSLTSLYSLTLNLFSEDEEFEGELGNVRSLAKNLKYFFLSSGNYELVKLCRGLANLKVLQVIDAKWALKIFGEELKNIKVASDASCVIMIDQHVTEIQTARDYE